MIGFVFVIHENITYIILDAPFTLNKIYTNIAKAIKIKVAILIIIEFAIFAEYITATAINVYCNISIFSI